MFFQISVVILLDSYLCQYIEYLKFEKKYCYDKLVLFSLFSWNFMRNLFRCSDNFCKQYGDVNNDRCLISPIKLLEIFDMALVKLDKSIAKPEWNSYFRKTTSNGTILLFLID